MSIGNLEIETLETDLEILIRVIHNVIREEIQMTPNHIIPLHPRLNVPIPTTKMITHMCLVLVWIMNWGEIVEDGEIPEKSGKSIK